MSENKTTQYEEVKHKIPDLFQEIIKHDRIKPIGDVINLVKFTEWKRRHNEFMKSAQNYVTKQRGGNSN